MNILASSVVGSYISSSRVGRHSERSVMFDAAARGLEERSCPSWRLQPQPRTGKYVVFGLLFQVYTRPRQTKEVHTDAEPSLSVLTMARNESLLRGAQPAVDKLVGRRQNGNGGGIQGYSW